MCTFCEQTNVQSWTSYNSNYLVFSKHKVKGHNLSAQPKTWTWMICGCRIHRLLATNRHGRPRKCYVLHWIHHWVCRLSYWMVKQVANRYFPQYRQGRTYFSISGLENSYSFDEFGWVIEWYIPSLHQQTIFPLQGILRTPKQNNENRVTRKKND